MYSFVKDPDATLDYGLDWSEWLEPDDTISSVTWVVPEGVTKESENNSDTMAVIWLSGGTAGAEYEVVCRITTTNGRIDDRTIQVYIAER